MKKKIFNEEFFKSLIWRNLRITTNTHTFTGMLVKMTETSVILRFCVKVTLDGKPPRRPKPSQTYPVPYIDIVKCEKEARHWEEI